MIMDYESYARRFFKDPPPEPSFAYLGLHGITLYFGDYEAAVDFYSRVLGEPGYAEGQDTRGWRIGNTWLTLLKGRTGSPQNVEVTLRMTTPQEAERLQAAFIESGGSGESPTDQLMYEPVRYCPVMDPFGTPILIIASLAESGN
jgi:catechol 2,3-dioxygenase-like lactoylglutathione lyase family enzyme